MRSRLLALLTVTGLCLASSGGAQSGETFSRWNECLAKGGAGNQDFDCARNEGAFALVSSFRLDAPVSQVHKIRSQILITTTLPCDGPGPCQGPDLAPWWQLSSGLCREGSIAGSTYFSTPPYNVGTGCTNPWAGKLAITGTSMTFPVPGHPLNPGVDKLRIDLVTDVPNAQAFTLSENTEYYAAHLDLDAARTIGEGSCQGCCNTVWIMSQTTLYTLDGLTLDIPPSYYDAASWQWDSTPCGPTPVARGSWGLMKSMYR